MSGARPVSQLAGKEGLIGRELLGPGGPGPLRTTFPIGLAHLGVCTASGGYCGPGSKGTVTRLGQEHRAKGFSKDPIAGSHSGESRKAPG